MPKQTVSPGDCFNSFAKQFGFFNYQTIYKHADNSTLWTNPNQLEEGGSVDIPDKNPKKLPLKLDAQTPFVIDRRKTKLRLVLTDYKKSALAPSSCSLTVGSAHSTKAPAASGLLEMEIDPGETQGTLKMSFPALPAPGAPPPDPAAGNPPANPPVILPSQFRDRAPKSQTDALEVTWELRIGYLERKEAVRGSLQRLNNLTFPTPIRREENDKTRRFVRGYQALRRAAAKTGNVTDIRDDLATYHDNP
jgi:hypothetical protein